MRLIPILILMFTCGCASPRLWVVRRDEISGVIAYQNYDPKSDNGARISNLIPCYPFKMIGNPIYGKNVAPTLYGYNSYGNGSGGYAYALDGGYIETAEFHYECVNNKSQAPSMVQPLDTTQLKISECDTGVFDACTDLANSYRKNGDLRNYEIHAEKACRLKSQFTSWACADLAEYYKFSKNDLALSATYYGLSCDSYRSSKSNKDELPDGCAFYGLQTNNTELKYIGLAEMKSRCLAKNNFACYKTASYFCEAKKKDEALTFIELAFRAGYADWTAIEKDQSFDPLRHDPRFKKLITEFKK